ncbi:MAG: ATP-binding protein [Oligoflexales bacterium]
MKASIATNVKFQATILSTTTLITFITYLTINHLYNNEKRDLKESLHTVLDTTKQALEAWTTEKKGTALTWAQSDIVRNLFTEISKENLIQSKYQKRLREHLKPLLVSHQSEGFFLVDKKYRNIGSTRDSNLNKINLLKNKESFFEKIWAGKPAITDPVMSDVKLKTRTNVSIFVGAPIHINKEIVGAFLLRINPDRQFNKILARGRIASSGETYTINSEGLLTSESRFIDQLKNLNLTNKKSTMLNVKVTVPNEDNFKNSHPINQPNTLLTVMAESLITDKNSQNANSNLDGYPDYRGIKVIGTWIWIESLNIGLTTEIDYDEAYDSYFDARKVIIFFYFICSLLVLTLLVFWKRREEYLEREIRSQTLDIRKSREEAILANRTKSIFLANMSHEIRTPMNGILGMASLVKEDISKLNISSHEAKEVNHRLEVLENSGMSLLDILNDILDFSKIEATKIKLESVPFNINQLVIEICELMNPKAIEKSITLRNEVEKNVPDFILGDPTRVRQVLSNLISNAIKFTEEGGVLVHVDEKSEDGQIILSVSVQDSGIGIKEESKDNLFKTFSQVDASTTRHFGGTGLGLAISKALIELMGGQIGFNSIYGVGTTFTFSFKTVAVESKVSPQIISPKKNDDVRGKILVADDNETNRQVAKGFLAKFQLSVDFAENGRIALEKAVNGKYDIIFMDCHMPEMDGFEATHKIIDILGDNRPVIVAITASVMKEDKKRCEETGMDDFLAKPIKKSEVSRILKKFLEI